MPFKVCPNCNTKHGARRLTCTCGHDFGCKRSGKHAIVAIPTDVPAETVAVVSGKKRRRRKTQDGAHEFPYPEPGTWIWDRPKGMPPICPPSDLPQGPLSAGVIKAQVSYEGLGFCIYSFIKADRIADPRLRELWIQARATMQEIVGYLDQTPWEAFEEAEESEEEEDEEEEEEEEEETDEEMSSDV